MVGILLKLPGLCSHTWTNTSFCFYLPVWISANVPISFPHCLRACSPACSPAFPCPLTSLQRMLRCPRPSLGQLVVALQDGRTFEGRVLSFDSLSDIALVKVDTHPHLHLNPHTHTHTHTYPHTCTCTCTCTCSCTFTPTPTLTCRFTHPAVAAAAASAAADTVLLSLGPVAHLDCFLI